MFANPVTAQQPAAKKQRTTSTSSKPGKSTGSTKTKKDEEAKKSRKEILECRKRQSEAEILTQLTVSREDYKHDDDELYGDVRGLLKHHGLVIIRNALADDDVDKIYKVATSTQHLICDTLDKKSIPYNSPVNNTKSICFEELAIRCQGRMDVRYCDSTAAKKKSGSKKKDKAQKLPDLSLIDNLAASVLHGGEAPEKVYSGWIFSFPNSQDQPWHQDGSPLFEHGTENLPSYAINVFCGLHDTQLLELGPTEFVVGSHHMEPESAIEKTDTGEEVVSAVLGKGDILLYDYRICHRGTSNISMAASQSEGKKKKKSSSDEGIIRKVLYLMYARPWFKEHLNFGDNSLFADE